MSDKQSEFATWLYRGIISILLFATSIMVKSNYDDFKQMKTDIEMDKREHAALNEWRSGITATIEELKKRP